MLRGQFGHAVRAYAKETLVNPSDAYAHCRLGDALICKGDLDDALRSYMVATRLAPRNGYIFYRLGVGACRQTRFSLARRATM